MTIIESQKTPLAKQKSKVLATARPILFNIAHPRYPKATVNTKGGEFMEKGSKDYKIAVVTRIMLCLRLFEDRASSRYISK